jgi:hypothetical protein
MNLNSNIAKKLLGCCALMGVLQAATAQPPIVAIPAGLNPAGPSYPTPNGGSAVLVGEELFATGGEVYVTDLGPTRAAYSEDLLVASPGNAFGQFMNNHSTPNGTTYDLGSYAAGTEIEFGLYVFDTQNTWYDGPASRNADGVVHAYMVNNYEGLANTTYVGFEDLAAPVADFNYVDEVYAFTGVGAASAPDAASTLSLLGMAMTALACFGRRSRK